MTVQLLCPVFWRPFDTVIPSQSGWLFWYSSVELFPTCYSCYIYYSVFTLVISCDYSDYYYICNSVRLGVVPIAVLWAWTWWFLLFYDCSHWCCAYIPVTWFGVLIRVLLLRCRLHSVCCSLLFDDSDYAGVLVILHSACCAATYHTPTFTMLPLITIALGDLFADILFLPVVVRSLIIVFRCSVQLLITVVGDLPLFTVNKFFFFLSVVVFPVFVVGWLLFPGDYYSELPMIRTDLLLVVDLLLCSWYYSSWIHCWYLFWWWWPTIVYQ